MVEAVIEDIAISGEGDEFLVLIRTVEDEILPLVVDQGQAMALIAARHGDESLRPGTHELVLSVVEMLGATIKRIEITELKGDTYYSQLVLERQGIEIEVDSRPSDALALATLGKHPILVARKIMELNAYTDELGDSSCEA